MKKKTESDFVHVVLAWLKVAKPDGVFFRSNTGAMLRTDTGGRRRYVRFGVPGMADIQGCYHGKAYFIECKSPTGRLSPAQIVFGEAIKRTGNVYIVARSLEEVAAGFG
jgi:hypothetical protein